MTTGLPVLMYHSIGGPLSQRYADLVVAPALLQEQVGALRSAGFAALGLTDALAAHARGERVVALTFDDGYIDFAEQAVPVQVGEGRVRQLPLLDAVHGGGRAPDVLPLGRTDFDED